MGRFRYWIWRHYVDSHTPGIEQAHSELAGSGGVARRAGPSALRSAFMDAARKKKKASICIDDQSQALTSQRDARPETQRLFERWLPSSQGDETGKQKAARSFEPIQKPVR